MLVKLEEDAEVAYQEYDRAVASEDRAETYVAKVKENFGWSIKIWLLGRKPSWQQRLLQS